MRRKGFTLVEIIAVISILAILLLVTVPLVNGIIKNSKLKAFRVTAEGIVEAARIYNTENGYNAIGSEEFDVLDKNLSYENKSQILEGFVCYIGNKYVIYIKSENYCAYNNPFNGMTNIEAYEIDDDECEIPYTACNTEA